MGVAKFTQKDPEIIHRALQLCEKLGDPKAAAEELRAQLKGEGREDEAPAWRTIYYWRNKDKGARPPGKMPIPRRDRKARGKLSAIPERAAMAAALTSAETSPPAGAPAPAQVPMAQAPAAPPGLSGTARRLWMVQHEIADVRDMLAQAKAEVRGGNAGALGKVSSLTEKLQNMLEYEQKLEPNEAGKVDAAREQQELAARVVAKIERAVKEARPA